VEISRRAAIESIAAFAALAACGTAKKEPGLAASGAQSSQLSGAAGFASALDALEARHKAHVGVFALHTGSGRTLEYHADQRFMMCSTFKALLVGAVLRTAQDKPGLLEQVVPIPADPGPGAGYAPFARGRLGASATVAELCEASIQVSDNIAANLLIALLGGPAEVTGFFRRLGDETTRLDRYEEAMSDGDPQDLLDTTTPRAIATSLRALTLGDALAEPMRDRLVHWMLGTSTGIGCIRAGLPADWKIADKTGTGARGERNDIAVAWPDGGRAPMVISVLTIAPRAEKPVDQLLADVAAAARSALALK
jgi:beta-lactamase class A